MKWAFNQFVLKFSLIAALAACVETDKPVFQTSDTDYQPVAQGYWQSCLIARLAVSSCELFRLEYIAPNTALLWSPGPAKPNTVVFESLSPNLFIMQFSTDKGFNYALGRLSSEGKISVQPPSCRIVIDKKQQFVDAGIELAANLSETRCSPKNTDAQSLKAFFELIALTHNQNNAAQASFHLRPLTAAEGQRAFEDAATKPKS